MTHREIIEHCIQKDIKLGLSEDKVRKMYSQKSFETILLIYAHYSKLEHLRDTGEVLNYDTHKIIIDEPKSVEELLDSFLLENSDTIGLV